jgi:hypothetical protein
MANLRVYSGSTYSYKYYTNGFRVYNSTIRFLASFPDEDLPPFTTKDIQYKVVFDLNSGIPGHPRTYFYYGDNKELVKYVVP